MIQLPYPENEDLVSTYWAHVFGEPVLEEPETLIDCLGHQPPSIPPDRKGSRRLNEAFRSGAEFRYVGLVLLILPHFNNRNALSAESGNQTVPALQLTVLRVGQLDRCSV